MPFSSESGSGADQAHLSVTVLATPSTFGNVGRGQLEKLDLYPVLADRHASLARDRTFWDFTW